MFELGVNRISIGAQSFNDKKLKKLGRLHDSQRAKNCVKIARKKGFRNISLDLIFGVRAETLGDWKKDLEDAARLGVQHISCYALDCKELESGKIAPALYEYAMDYLPTKGYIQYEISNFSKKGFACKHNLNYWDNGPYTGLGPSAVSYAKGKREENISDIASYIERSGSGASTAAYSEKLDRMHSARETAAIKIRTMEGIDLEWFKKKTGLGFLKLEKKALPRLIEDGLVYHAGRRAARKAVRLTPKGVLFCDIVSSAFL
jgi:oxygen-independent coproporphyrinogen-3 oxidase